MTTPAKPSSLAARANPAIFREYDVRGVSGRDLTPGVVRALGRAFATFALRAGDRRFVVGRDCRMSSPGFRDALIEGMTAAGADVLDVGLVPTPVLYFSTFHFDRPAGVMITGSHNPPDHNGFKMLVGRAALHGSQIQQLRTMIDANDYGPPPEAPGVVTEGDALTPYRARIAGDARFARRDLRIVLDAGNGMGGPTASALYRELGFDPVLLYCDLDGTFPNHHPDPSDEHTLDALKRAVLESRADLGIAYDGDADRLGVVCIDAAGKPRVLWGDELLILFARALLRDQPGATVIGEVKCSQRLFDDIAKHGGQPIMWKVGHSLIKAKMKETHAALAGEMSGHMFFAHRWYGFDDAIYASTRLAEILAAAPAGATLDGLLSDVPPALNTPEIRVDCSDETKFQVVARAAEIVRRRWPEAKVVDIDGVRATWPDGWGLLRASNTQPVVVMRFEARDPAALARVRSCIDEALAEARR